MKVKVYEKSKIVFFTPNFHRGGSERNILNIINSLDKSLFEITLCICGEKSEYSKLIDSDCITIIQWNKSSVKKSLKDIVKFLRNEEPQVVFSSSTHLSFYISILKLIMFDLKFKNVIRIPSLLSNNLGKGWQAKIINSFISFTYRQADVIISQSLEMKEEVDFYNKDKFKSIVVNNLIDFNNIKKQSEEYKVKFDCDFVNIVAAGSLYSVKGFDLLIFAFKKLTEVRSDVRLYILGEESVEKGYFEYLNSLIMDLELEENVFLTGFIENPYPFFKDANLFVLSSLKEGFPNVVLESLALGTPVVATNCVNFDFVINSTNGIVVEKGSVNALFTGMERVIGLNNFVFDYKNFDFNQLFLKTIK